MQYAVIRAAKPDCVLETGVANDVSSAYLLLAMERNEKGALYSIDVNDGSFLPGGKQVGRVVLAWLRGRWTLRLGDARELLPRMLAELKSLDVFIHDSLHTYDHMKFEYEQVICIFAREACGLRLFALRGRGRSCGVSSGRT